MTGNAPPARVGWVLLFPQRGRCHIAAPVQHWHGQRSSPAPPLNHQHSTHLHFEILALALVRLPQCTTRETQLCWESPSGDWGEQTCQKRCKDALVQLLLLATRHTTELLRTTLLLSPALGPVLIMVANRKSTPRVWCKGLSSSCWRTLCVQEMIFLQQ